MGEQLSLKAAMPLAEILATCRKNVSNTGPRMDICQIGYDICEFDTLRGLGIDVIGRVHFDNRDRFAIWMGSIGDRTMSTNEWLLTSDFWQFLEPWHGRWYENEIFIASCTDNIYDLENERWLLGDMIDNVGIYGSRVAEGLSAFNVGLVSFEINSLWPSGAIWWHRSGSTLAQVIVRACCVVAPNNYLNQYQRCSMAFTREQFSEEMLMNCNKPSMTTVNPLI